MRLAYVVAFCISLSSCNSDSVENVDPCPFLVWMAGSESDVLPKLENATVVSIFGVLAGTTSVGEKVRLEGRLVVYQNSTYLVPAGSSEYASTFSDRVRIDFSHNGGPSKEEIDQAGIVMTVGVLIARDRQWVLENPLYISSLHAASEECVNVH